MPQSPWRGEAAGPNTKRARAQRRYPDLDTCEVCQKAPAVERHHRDGNLDNFERDNIVLACRKCHMRLDGRLALLATYPGAYLRRSGPCVVCGQPGNRLRSGMCEKCYTYQRRHGSSRPLDASPLHLLTHAGRTATITEWAAITGLARSTIRARLKAGWSAADVLSTARWQKPAGP